MERSETVKGKRAGGRAEAPLGRSMAAPPAVARLVRWRYLRRFGAILVGGLGLTATLISFRLLQDREDELREADFKYATNVAGWLAQREFDSGTTALRSLVSFHSSSTAVERYEFESFSRTLLDEAPIVGAVAWAPEVSAAERAQHETRVRRSAESESSSLTQEVVSALEGYRICEWSDDGGHVPVTGDHVSYPVEYIEPLSKYRGLLGMDLATHPAIGKAIERAVALGRRESGGQVCLPGAPKEDLCFLVVDRAFQNGSTEGQLNGPSGGVFVAVFRVAKLVRVLRERLDGPPFDIAPEFGRITQSRLDKMSGVFLKCLFPSEHTGLGFRLTRKDSLPESRAMVAPISLLLGLCCTGLLAAYVFLLTHWNSHVEEQVAQRTEELREANVRLSSEISERREAEHKLERQAEELARSNSDLEEFAYLASHDLRAPLRAIANISEWLEEDLGDSLKDDSRRQLELLRKRVVRLERLVDDLLAYSRAGRDQAACESIDTRELVESIVFLLSLPPSFVVEVDGSMPVIVTRKAPLEQVFTNLIGNAIKHHHRKDGTIHVGARELDGFYEFSVADDGPGIEKRFHERIFKMFQGLQPRDKVEGSGMGLALVSKLVTRQGGAVRIDSEPGKGTRFTFTWPLGPSVEES